MQNSSSNAANAAAHEDAFASYIKANLHNSWLQQLSPDMEIDKHSPNKQSREVKSGHYVLVLPTPLQSPQLISTSRSLLNDMQISEPLQNSSAFLMFLSGNGIPKSIGNNTKIGNNEDSSVLKEFPSWATPYALSIYGQEMYSNCPFGNGNGYGDGRAVSIAEIFVNSKRFELQLKGGGKTPFCRGGDGRAVLRSSVREFLASEAMHFLRVPTTRALSLIVSSSEKVYRPWYSKTEAISLSVDDPRLDRFPREMRPHIINQFLEASKEPDTMVENKAAITCRVAPSFLRVGHVELFGRRARRLNTPLAMTQLQQMLDHVCFREYPQITAAAYPNINNRIFALLRAVAVNMSILMANWLRVGYNQGNFNSDNCLVGGRTMDYGPFGFIEKYDRNFCMWTGGGEHYAFLNQPTACFRNFISFAEALRPLLVIPQVDEDEEDAESGGTNDNEPEALKQLKQVVREFSVVCSETVNEMWAKKMGFSKRSESTDSLFLRLESLMQSSNVDFTVLFRELSNLAENYKTLATTNENNPDILSSTNMKSAFYEEITNGEQRQQWIRWINDWASELTKLEESTLDGKEVMKRMKLQNPKYIPRESFLVQAYQAAEKGDYQPLLELQKLFESPYDEQPEFEEKYYKIKTLSCVLRTPGTSFMT